MPQLYFYVKKEQQFALSFEGHCSVTDSSKFKAHQGEYKIIYPKYCITKIEKVLPAKSLHEKKSSANVISFMLLFFVEVVVVCTIFKRKVNTLCKMILYFYFLTFYFFILFLVVNNK